MGKYDKNLGYCNNSLTCVQHAGLDTKPPSESKYIFECSCGNLRAVKLAHVKSGSAKECTNCSKVTLSERTHYKTHGDTGRPLWKCWANMRMRVAHNLAYVNRTICPEWGNYEQFRDDMSEGYFEGAVLDRIDNSSGYSKDNCQWLTKSAHGTKTGEERCIKTH